MGNLIIRTAREEDLPQIIALVADIVVSKDPLKYADEAISDPPLQSYVEAFKEILSHPNTALVATLDSKIVGYTQISFISGLTRRGQKRAIVEDVRVHREARGHNVGRRLMEKATEEARSRNCWVIQLTTNKWREDAIAFYEKIGFSNTHEGFRIQLKS